MRNKKISINKEESKRLKKELKNAKNRTEARRIQIMVAYLNWLDYRAIKKAWIASFETISRTIDRYKEDPQFFYKSNYKGRVLSDEKKKQIKRVRIIIEEAESEGKYLDIKEVLNKYNSKFQNEQLIYSKIWLIIRKNLKYNYQKPYVIDKRKPDNAEQILEERLSDKIDQVVEKENEEILSNKLWYNEENSTESTPKKWVEKEIQSNLEEESIKISYTKENDKDECKDECKGEFDNENQKFSVIKKKWNEIDDTLKDKIAMYYWDESSIEISKKTWRVILKKGTKIKLKWVEMLHNSRSIFWFIRNDGQLRYSIRNKKKSKDFIYSLGRLCEKDKTKYKIIIVDNASIHKSKKVNDYCRKKWIFLVYLPPYSPDLNPIEQLWKIVKRKFMLTQWDIRKKLEQKIRNATNSIKNTFSILSSKKNIVSIIW